MWLVLYFLQFLTVNALTKEEALKKKSELLESGISSTTDPCEDFATYATYGIDETTLVKYKQERAEEVFSGMKSQFPPLQAVKQIFAFCAQQTPFPSRKFRPGKDQVTINAYNVDIQDYLNNIDLNNTEWFAMKYKHYLNILFTYGSQVFDEQILGTKMILNFEAYGQTDFGKDNCEDQIGKEACREMIAHIFDLVLGEELPVKLFFPSDVEDRRTIIYDIAQIFAGAEDPGPYRNCAELIEDVAPMYYRKIIFDFINQNEGSTNGLDEEFLKMLTDVKDAFKSSLYSMDLPDDNITKSFDKLRWLNITHPIFEDATFERYFNVNFTQETLYVDRHLNNMKRLIQYNFENGKNLFYTPRFDEHSTFIAGVDGHNYVGLGMHAISYPFYNRGFPPALTYSNFAFAFPEEKNLLLPTISLNDVAGIVAYNAFQRRNQMFLQQNFVEGPFISKLSQEQLYFFNLAQSLTMLDEDFANKTSDAWDYFKCSRAFSNAFHCASGDAYYKIDGCSVLIIESLIEPYYNYSHYKIDP
ncbi:unnamed protein product [Bursaphelenchus xylophilus]|uniref:(pine wood nematode) hypothetical protein n=1 Tax=Bursaphelenchus xylophilus TaxID=6326 RepID=A0A1I7RX99_BURXY|nr:unnamed protein product [Bursaphelenchus xylophilus]CAG9121465.1 unnamed protein product [Bursaphelenchus xylophilus]